MNILHWLMGDKPETEPDRMHRARDERWLDEEEKRQLQEVRERLERVEQQLERIRGGTTS